MAGKHRHMRYRTGIWLLLLTIITINLYGCSSCEEPFVCPRDAFLRSTCCCKSGPLVCTYSGCCKRPERCLPCPCKPICDECKQCSRFGRQKLIDQLALQNVQVVARGDNTTILLYTDNCFETGTPNIYACCYPTLDLITSLLASATRTCGPFRVTGYTDNVGERCDNKAKLSQYLADSVVNYLWAHGIPLHKMVAKGSGSCNPVATQHTTCGNAYNRRVEINFREHPCWCD